MSTKLTYSRLFGYSTNWVICDGCGWHRQSTQWHNDAGVLPFDWSSQLVREVGTGYLVKRAYCPGCGRARGLSSGN